MKLKISPEALGKQKKDALIVFVQADGILLESDHRALKKLISEYIKTSAFTGAAGQTALFPTLGKTASGSILLAGIGKPKDFHRALLEQAAAAAVRAGRQAGLKTFAASVCSRIKGVSDSD